MFCNLQWLPNHRGLKAPGRPGCVRPYFLVSDSQGPVAGWWLWQPADWTGKSPLEGHQLTGLGGWTHRAWFITSLLIKMWFKVLLISEGFKPLPSPQPFFSPPPAQMLLLSHNTPFLPLSVQAQHRGPEKMTHVLGNGKVQLPTNQPCWVLCSPLSQWQPTQWGLDGRLSCTPGTWQHVRRALCPSWVLYPVAWAVFPRTTLGACDHLSSGSSCLMEVRARARAVEGVRP